MSKGIVIDTIKKNLEKIDINNSVSITNLFSKTVISSVDTATLPKYYKNLNVTTIFLRSLKTILM